MSNWRNGTNVGSRAANKTADAVDGNRIKAILLGRTYVNADQTTWWSGWNGRRSTLPHGPPARCSARPSGLEVAPKFGHALPDCRGRLRSSPGCKEMHNNTPRLD
jgi:hypothetical protein